MTSVAPHVDRSRLRAPARQRTTLTHAEQIHLALAQEFQEAQHGLASHRKQVAILRALQAKAAGAGLEEEFNYSFCRLVNRVLPVKKTEAVGDRIVKLVANLVKSLQEQAAAEAEAEAEAQAETEDDEDISTDDSDKTGPRTARFITYLVQHLLRGIEAKNKTVRYRVCQFLAAIIHNMGEIDDELYQLLLWSLHKRVYDKEPSVRVQAVLCLASFQLDNPEESSRENLSDATKKLLAVLQNDANAEVRKAALLNVEKSNATLPYLLERARDCNAINRRLVYSKILPDVGDFRYLSVDKREKLLEWGLRDREESVRAAASKMFAFLWIENVNNDLIELLERLDVLNSSIAEVAMEVFFQQRKDLAMKIRFEPAFWLSLTAETAFLARTFHTYCTANGLTESIEQNFPVATEFSECLDRYFSHRAEIIVNLKDNGDVSSSSELAETDFVLEQLFLIAKAYDFSDEIGRRSVLALIRRQLGSVDMPDNLVDSMVRVLRLLAINERDFCQMVCEITSDIKDALPESADESNDSFHSAVSDISHASASDAAERQEGAASGPRSTVGQRKIVMTCLRITQHLLEVVDKKLEANISLMSLLDSIVTPAVRATDTEIREHGLRCLGLFCLIDRQLAIENLYLFGLCATKGNAQIRVEAYKIISDILGVHGNSILDLEGGIDSLSLYKLYYRGLRNNEFPDAQSIAAEGLCKLYLSDTLSDEDLFETLILTYFNPGTNDNLKLRQALSFCLPVYCFSHRQHQEKVSKILIDSVERLSEIYDNLEDKQEMTPPSQILQNLIYWTDPLRLVSSQDLNPEEADAALRDCSYQLEVAVGLLNKAATEDSKTVKKLYLSGINKVYMTEYMDKQMLEEYLELVQEIQDQGILTDVASRNLLSKAKANCLDLLNAAEALAAEENRNAEGEGEGEEEEKEDGEDDEVENMEAEDTEKRKEVENEIQDEDEDRDGDEDEDEQENEDEHEEVSIHHRRSSIRNSRNFRGKVSKKEEKEEKEEDEEDDENEDLSQDESEYESEEEIIPTSRRTRTRRAGKNLSNDEIIPTESSKVYYEDEDEDEEDNEAGSGIAATSFHNSSYSSVDNASASIDIEGDTIME